MPMTNFAAVTAFAGFALVAATGAFAADVNSEIMNARMHAGLAAQGSSIAMVHSHLHHAVNCLVGPGGTGFDAKELNPCQNGGSGAIPDEPDAAKKKTLQSAADKAMAGIAATDLKAAQENAAQVVSLLTGAK